MKITYLFRPFISFLAFIFLAAYAVPPAYPEIVDRVVAVVNDGIITLSELNAETAVFLGGLKGGEPPKAGNAVETRSKVLDNLVEKMLMKQSAERAGIEVSEREIDNAVEDIKKQNNITQQTLLTALAQSGLTYAQYRDQLKEDIRRVKFANQQFRSRVSVRDEDVEEYYRQNMEQFFTPPSYNLRVLLLPAAEGELQKTRLAALEEEIKRGRDFAELIKEYSEGPDIQNGGDIGYVKSGEVSAQLEEAAKTLKKGEISPPITAPEGIYMIQLLDGVEGKAAPLEKVRDAIKNTIYQKTVEERYKLWITEMKRISHIDIRL
ncbi:MAG: SurA N-terminal domain-containing protein [Deltaproteobacteria bacterium]|nr:SurA N-terminal domain-containing protein [Deltaproteobacteria bacterium]